MKQKTTMKLLPHSIEAEIAILGGVIQYPEKLPEVQSLVSSDDFFIPKHREIFKTLCDLNQLDVPIDTISIVNQLKEGNRLDEVGGATYLAEIVEKVPTAANIEYHARLVREAADKRGIIRLCHEIQQKAYGAAKPVELAADLAETALRISRNGSDCENVFIRGRELLNLHNSANLYLKGQHVKTETELKLDLLVKLAVIGAGIGTVGDLLLSFYVHFWK